MITLKLEARFDEERGRTVIYDSVTGTVMFEATEAGAEQVQNITEVAIQLVLGQFEQVQLTNDEPMPVGCRVVTTQFIHEGHLRPILRHPSEEPVIDVSAHGEVVEIMPADNDLTHRVRFDFQQGEKREWWVNPDWLREETDDWGSTPSYTRHEEGN